MTPSLRYAERVGGVLVAPSSTLRAIVATPNGQGATDIAWLVAARLLAGETPRVLRAIFRGVDLGPMVGLTSLLATLQQVLPDVLGILAAGLLMSLFAGARPKGATAATGAEPLDLAAYAWVPYLAVELVGSLAFTLLGIAPPPAARLIIDGVAVGWALIVWTLGLTVLRAARKEAA